MNTFHFGVRGNAEHTSTSDKQICRFRLMVLFQPKWFIDLEVHGNTNAELWGDFFLSL